MTIIDDLLSTLDSDAAVRDIRLGSYWTAVLTRNCGLASSPHDTDHHNSDAPVRDAGRLADKEALELAEMARSESSLEAAIGMAAINSLLMVDEGRCVELNAADLLMERGRNKKVALIGHFPFVKTLRQAAGELWVIERHPREGDIAESEVQSHIPRADVVAITGSAFVNHTIENLLGLCSTRAYVVVLGPTTPLSPVLFDHGVDVISGTRVVEPETVLRYVSQGATFRQMEGVRLLTMMKR
ncbi:MAG TPA: DUF364 domain-containing protein [Dehalococcoidia bacterium]|nr:DUF364 domain-containing protein [Dehalococcoidia bacterium]